MSLAIDDLLFDALTADPASPEQGQVWYRADLQRFTWYDGAQNQLFDTPWVESGPNIFYSPAVYGGVGIGVDPGTTPVVTSAEPSLVVYGDGYTPPAAFHIETQRMVLLASDDPVLQLHGLDSGTTSARVVLSSSDAGTPTQNRHWTIAHRSPTSDNGSLCFTYLTTTANDWSPGAATVLLCLMPDGRLENVANATLSQDAANWRQVQRYRIMELLRDRGVTRDELFGVGPGLGLLEDIFADTAALDTAFPPGPTAKPSYAMVANGTEEPDVYWLQTGGTVWQQSTYQDSGGPYSQPPDPLGTWLVNPNDALGTPAAGQTSTYWMGSEFRILTAGDGLDMNAIAIKCGTNAAGLTRNWEIRRSTLVQLVAPALTTYTTIVQSGTQVMTGGSWDVIPITPITVAENEWYVVWWGNGNGWQSQSIATLGGDLNESFADLNGGVFLFNATAAPPTPSNRQPTVIYGLATARII